MDDYCQCRANPLVGSPKLQMPPAFMRQLVKSPKILAREVEGFKTTALHSFVRQIYRWLHKYGIPSIGYTFMPAKAYYKDAQKQFKNTSYLGRMTVPCDGFLLVSRKSYSPMLGIMSGNIDTNIAESFHQETGSEEKTLKVLKELRRELEQLAEDNDVRLGDVLPQVFKPSDKNHYKARNYDVYPMWFGDTE